MPAYLIAIEEKPGLTFRGGHNKMIVFANDAANAKAMANAYYDNDVSGLFTTYSTATELVAGSDMSDGNWELFINIYDHDPAAVQFAATGGTSGVIACSVDTAGASYSAGNVLSVAGGTATRAATVRVTTVGGSGEITGVEVVDPGLYTVNPTVDANVATGGDGTGGKVDLVMGTDDYMNICARMVDTLNATAIDGAAVDFGEAGIGSTDRTFTVAAIGDAIGDENMIVEMRYKGVAIPVFVGTITDGGIAAAVLKFIMPAAASRVVPNVLATLRD